MKQLKTTIAKIATAWLFLGFAACNEQTEQASVLRQGMVLQLGDFQAKAEMTLPPGDGPFPGVLLVHPSGTTDMDATLKDADGQLKARNFHVLSDHLSRNGFAVLRYNKRYVLDADSVDIEKFRTLGGPDLLDDARVALNVLRAHPAVDEQRVFLYGASQGTRIVANLAVEDEHVRGIALQAPPVLHFRRFHRPELLRNVILPYVLGFSDDDRIGGAELAGARDSEAGEMVKAFLGWFGDLSGEELVVSPALDTDGNGELDLDLEIEPAIAAMTSDTSRPYILKTPMRLVPEFRLPILILQGESDAVIAVDFVHELVRALNEHGVDNTLRLYPGLGHTLGPAATRLDDDLREIDAAPMKDLVLWLTDQLKRGPDYDS